MASAYYDQLEGFRRQWNPSNREEVMPSEHFWVNLQQWLESRGYMLRPRYKPEWVPSWRGTKKWALSCEDGQPIPATRSHLMDATRISDGTTVALKMIFKSEHPYEAEISAFWSSEPLASDPGNHCIPVFEVLEVPNNDDMLLLVMPFLRPYDDPRFETIGEAVEFFRQVFEGIHFMHKHHVAHRDCSGKNIMMDATLLYPNGYHPVDIFLNRDYHGWAKHYTRTERPPKYLLIDFGLSRRYDPKDGLPRELPIRGGDKTVPEFQGQGYYEPSDPFATDIYYLGNMIKEDFLDSNFGFDFISHLVADMIQDEPSKRPTIDQVMARFKPVYYSLSPSQLRSRVVQRKEDDILRRWRNSVHFFRRVRYTLQRVSPVPSDQPHELLDDRPNGHQRTLGTRSRENLEAQQEVHAVKENREPMRRTSLTPTEHLERRDEGTILGDPFQAKKERAADVDWWDNEPANPRNWSVARKWRNVAVVSFYSFISSLASTMIAPGLPEIGEHYHVTNPTVIALTLSIYILSYAIGPLVVGPLSEVYGRMRILHLSNLFFTAFTLGCIFAPNIGALIFFRYSAGMGACAPLAIGGGSISDMFTPKNRATAMGVYTIGSLIGPIVGPIAGGFMVQSIGFKWVFILLTILAGVGALVGIFCFEETYAPVIKDKVARRMKDEEASRKVLPYKMPTKLTEALRGSLSRPLLLLTGSFICFILSFLMALTYGSLYIMYTTFPTTFSEIYGWGPGASGLAYLGPGIGFIVGTVVAAPVMDKFYRALCERNGGHGKPEFRIPPMVIGSFLVPIGLFWHGWSAQARMHWIMPIVGAGVFSTGMMFAFLSIQLYLMDAFTYAASALAAASLFRGLFGLVFPLFGEQMFTALGLGGGNSLLAGLAIVTGVPFPIWIYYKGEQMRARNKLNR